MQDFLNSDFIKFIYVFGIGQAILLFVLLARKRINVISNRFLSAIFILCGIELISGIYYLGKYFENFPEFIGLTNGFAYLFGPLMYFYVYFLEPENRFNFSKVGIHFLPFLLAFAFYIIPIFVVGTAEKLEFVEQQFAFNTPTKVLGFLAPFHPIIYILVTLLEIRKIIANLKNNFSNVEFANIYWLKYFFYGLLFQAAIVIILHIFEESFSFDIKYIMLLSVAVFMILAGYISLKQPELKSFILKNKNDFPAKKEYKRITLKNEQIEEFIKKVKKALEVDKLYLNPKLSLKELSNHTGISTHNLTELINMQMNLSFYDLINSYRIKEIKKLIKEDSEKKYSLLALAYESGFSSKTSFNTIFKKFVMMTPSEYRNKIQNK